MSVPSASPDLVESSPRAISRGGWLGLGLVGVVMVANWVAAVARFQVNCPYWDQWDFSNPMFASEGWYELFTVQHGPHRQGLAFVLTSWVLRWSHWDSRIESLWIVGQMLGATALAVRLRWKMAGRLSWTDLWIPLAMLSLSQFENVLLVPNGSHSVFPTLLLMLAANGWVGRKRWWRWPGLGVVAVAATFTGFGFFVGLMMTALLLLAVGRVVLERRWRDLGLVGVGFGMAVVGWVWFFHGYVYDAASDGYEFPHHPVADYGRFGVLMLAGRMGFYGVSGVAYLVGGILGSVSGAVGLRAGWRLMRGTGGSRDAVVVLLVGTGLAFAVFTAIGRVHLGIDGGMVSRYGPLLTPLWLGLLTAAGASQVKARLGRWPVIAVTVVGWALAVGPMGQGLRRPVAEWPGTVGISDSALGELRMQVETKIEWLYGFEQTGDWRGAEAWMPQGVHPNAVGSNLEAKIAWLRARGWSFLEPGLPPMAWLPWWPSSEGMWLHSADAGLGRHWIASEGELQIAAGEPGYLNVRLVGSGQTVKGDAVVEMALDGKRATATVDQWKRGIAVPVDEQVHRLVVRSFDPPRALAPPDDLRVASVEVETPRREREARFPVWVWLDSTQDYGLVRRLTIESGFWGWEGEGADRFGWTAERLTLAVNSRRESWLNVSIGGRFVAVNRGAVTVAVDGRRWTVALEDGRRDFAVPLPVDGALHRVTIENEGGARSPQAEGDSDDSRELALSLRRLSIDPAPAYAELP